MSVGTFGPVPDRDVDKEGGGGEPRAGVVLQGHVPEAAAEEGEGGDVGGEVAVVRRRARLHAELDEAELGPTDHEREGLVPRRVETVLKVRVDASSVFCRRRCIRARCKLHRVTDLRHNFGDAFRLVAEVPDDSKLDVGLDDAAPHRLLLRFRQVLAAYDPHRQGFGAARRQVGGSVRA